MKTELFDHPLHPLLNHSRTEREGSENSRGIESQKMSHQSSENKLVRMDTVQRKHISNPEETQLSKATQEASQFTIRSLLTFERITKIKVYQRVTTNLPFLFSLW